ncbi:4'-phosphopantetheinyl transferase superfamily protein [Dokdonia sp.]|uniref:4'-phosphopantetheinyl transferase family protein n=1 Tax=Dokdonia sp. TaxID=2024995 RepID=UPI003262FC38
MIDIFYTRQNKQVSAKYWSYYLSLLPKDMINECLKYFRWQDRQACVFGKLLLIEGLSKYGFEKSAITDVHYGTYKKPYLYNDINFNISHAGELVICAIGKNQQIGVDVEEIKHVEFKDFHSVMTNEQWRDINNSQKPIRMFFKYWTYKESMVKADGRGLSIPFIEIHVNNNEIEYEGKKWHLKEFSIAEGYSACLASDFSDFELAFTEMDFNHGIEVVKAL